MSDSIETIDTQALRQAITSNQMDGYWLVDHAAKLITQHYVDSVAFPLNYLMVREAIYAIHGQTRPADEHTVWYAIELLEKAKLDALDLTFDPQCLISPLQFFSPRHVRRG